MPAPDPADQRSVRLSSHTSAQIRRLPLPSPASDEHTAGAARFDTSERALSRRGLTLSRSDDPERGWLLCIPQGDDHWSVEIPRLRSAPERMPAALVQLLDGIIGQDELVEIDDDASDRPQTSGKDSSTKAGGTKDSAPTGVDVLQAVLSQQADALELWDLKTRLDLPDALHQLRVTARSLRGLLKSARPFLDREAADTLGDQLQQLGRLLAAARDAEVMAELLPARAEALQGRIGEKTRHVLVETAQERAESSAAQIRQDASRPECLAALESARAAALHPPFTDKGGKKAAGLTAEQMSDRLVQRALRKAAKEAQRALDAAQAGDLEPEQRLEHLHTVRKATKRVRYVTKVLKASGFRPAKSVRKLGKAAKRAQDALGETMDASVAAAWLEDSSARLRRAGADPYELGLLTGAELRRVAQGLDEGHDDIERLTELLERHAG
ncbi:CHAD domain-containing protein [Kocuria palustris]|uniref:CHAD domain-containing protein n=1 Tax=Kocuria palustris TaxID=71999 RepID=UPI0011A2A909|nr:CHAD domain-containing protein [Kocuria palustris]